MIAWYTFLRHPSIGCLFFITDFTDLRDDFTDVNELITRIFGMQRMEFTPGMKAVVKICVIGVQICFICNYFA